MTKQEQPFQSDPQVHDQLALAAQLLRAARQAAVLVHRNPDGDCVGAATALADAMRAHGCTVEVVSPDPLTGALVQIPGAEAITTSDTHLEPDLWVTVDVSDPKLLLPLRAAETGFLATRNSINIDHHVSNLRFARVNYVDSEAASAAEIVYDLLGKLRIRLDARSATQLMFGVVNDTHSFQNSNTTARTLRIAADLVENGAALDTVIYRLLLERSVSSARLWAGVLPSLRFHAGGAMASLVVSTQALTDAGAIIQDADGLVEFLRNIRGVSLAVLLKQIGPSRFRLSLRSDDSVDATSVAGAYGGGGHRRAAGCDADGTAEEILGTIVTEFHRYQHGAHG